MASNKFADRMEKLGLESEHNRYGNFYPVKRKNGGQA
jgi:hypothetical protein